MHSPSESELGVLSHGYDSEEPIMYGQAVLGERQLWCAIIEQAFIDVGLIADPRGVGRGKTAQETETQDKSRLQKCYDDAARWLLHGKQDFFYVCMMAGISPSLIRCVAQQKLKA